MPYNPRRRKICLFARFGRLEEMRRVRASLQGIGYEVVSSWLDEDPATEGRIDRAEADRLARVVYNEIMRSSVAVCFIDNHPNGSRGGHQVEFGYALAKGKVVISVGRAERNIFHQDWRVRQFMSTDAFLEAARSWTNFIPPQSSSTPQHVS